MFKFEVVENGLKITHDNHEELAEELKERGSESTFFDNAERYRANGWYVGTADQLGGLSECFVIGEHEIVTDEGENYPNYDKPVWTNIRNYQVVCPIEQILEKGFVIFDKLES